MCINPYKVTFLQWRALSIATVNRHKRVLLFQHTFGTRGSFLFQYNKSKHTNSRKNEAQMQ